MGSKTYEEFMREDLADPEARASWEACAVGRALGIWLITYRIDHGLEFDQLAERLGLDSDGLADLEEGDQDPPAAALLELSRQLDTAIVLRVERGVPGEAVETITIDARQAQAA
ncbi:MAG: helix-turn-helix transcriptional regulator [Armatimonadetes bacterium]|nr:helix-turn-helix transcriptional regulator [Armatimonadota bacterium]